ncbi:PHD and RING finger domain-containing protein 1-like [Eucyclogobius newberryi]|uniref:PHD and RING finger domain-containing protein 1-like n=1 Tax=Eucyclogobius newberryi TaxID=166745 RepID=UPI003B5A8A66
MEDKEEAGVCGEKCYICLCSFEEQTVGSLLENCKHDFCLECIVQWSKTANTCPVDRSTFTSIHQRKRLGDVVQKKIRVSPPTRPDELEEASLPVICETCGRSDRTSRMLLCSRCDSGFHMNCLTPAVSERPEDPWECPECDVTLNEPDSFAAEDDVSDGELDDILSEAGEICSRLRPSTLTSGVSGWARRGERVRTRSNRDPAALQPVTRVPKYLLQASSSSATAGNRPGATTSVSQD